jgi:stage III sporulation protein AA
MKTVIINRKCQAIPSALLRVLPYRLTDEISRCQEEMIEEIRVRRERCASLTCGDRHVLLDCRLDGQEMDELFFKLCGGSVYAYAESVAQGYINFGEGIRVGVCGRAAVEGGRIIGVNQVSSIVIRLPHRAPVGVGALPAELVRQGGGGGVLVYSKPGVGKTTVLRDAAALLASGAQPMRVAVVDTRGELGYSLEAKRLTVDILTGYPRKEGIAVATRTLGAQVIVCDEIGDADEAAAIVSAHNCGVPLLASAHAESVRELMSKPGIAQLHQSRVFGQYLHIARRPSREFEYDYTVTDAEHADAYV